MHANWLEHALSTQDVQAALTCWVPGGPPMHEGPLNGNAELPELLLLHAIAPATNALTASTDAHTILLMESLLVGTTIPDRLPARAFHGNTA